MIKKHGKILTFFFILSLCLCALGQFLSQGGQAYADTYVARVERGGSYAFYSTLGNAFENAQDDDVIVVLSNVEIENTIGISCDCTINLGGYTLSANTDVFCVTNNASVTISGGTLVSNSGRAIVVSDENANADYNLTLSSLTINSTTSVAVELDAIGTYNIQNCTLNSAVKLMVGNLTMSGTTIEASGKAVIVEAKEPGCTATFTLCTITSTGDYALGATFAENEEPEYCRVKVVEGNWTGEANHGVFSSTNDFNPANEDFYILIGSGRFSHDVTDYCPVGWWTTITEDHDYAPSHRLYQINYICGEQGVLSEDGASSFYSFNGNVILKTASIPDGRFDGWYENDALVGSVLSGGRQVQGFSSNIASELYDRTFVAKYTLYAQVIYAGDTINASTDLDAQKAISDMVANDYVKTNSLLTITNNSLLDGLTPAQIAELKTQLVDGNNDPVDVDEVDNLNIRVDVEIDNILLESMRVVGVEYKVFIYVIARNSSHDVIGSYKIENLQQVFGESATITFNLPIPTRFVGERVKVTHGADDIRTFDILQETNDKYVPFVYSDLSNPSIKLETTHDMIDTMNTAKTNSVFTFHQDYQFDRPEIVIIPSGKNIILNTNGFDVTGENALTFVVRGNLVVNALGSTLNIHFVVEGSSSSLEINDGTFVSQSGPVLETMRRAYGLSVSATATTFLAEQGNAITIYGQGSYTFLSIVVEGENGFEIGGGSISIINSDIVADDACFVVRQAYAGELASLTINGGRFTGEYALLEDGEYIKENIATQIYISGGTFNGIVQSACCKRFINGGYYLTKPAVEFFVDGRYVVDSEDRYQVVTSENAYIFATNRLLAVDKYFESENIDEYISEYELLADYILSVGQDENVDGREKLNELLLQKQSIQDYNDASSSILEIPRYAFDIEACQRAMDEYLQTRTALGNVTDASNVYYGVISSTAESKYNVLTEQRRIYYTIDIPVPVAQTFVYNKQVQTYFDEDNLHFAIRVNNNSRKISGEQVVTLSLQDGFNWADGTNDDKEYTFSIAKANIDVSGLSFINRVVAYNGAVKSIYVTGDIPKYMTVTYQNNDQVNAGTYNVLANFVLREDMALNYNTPEPMEAVLTITRARFELEGIRFDDGGYEFDGKSKSLYIDGDLPEGVSVVYSGNSQASIGNHLVTAYFTLSDDLAQNYLEPSPISANLTILGSSMESVPTWALIATIAGISIIALAFFIFMTFKRHKG